MASFQILLRMRCARAVHGMRQRAMLKAVYTFFADVPMVLTSGCGHKTILCRRALCCLQYAKLFAVLNERQATPPMAAWRPLQLQVCSFACITVGNCMFKCWPCMSSQNVQGGGTARYLAWRRLGAQP